MLRRDREYTMVVDWWSLGILCFELLKGQPPFYSGNVERVYEKILKAKLEFPAAVREDARKLISALLEREPSARLGATGGAQQVKAHPPAPPPLAFAAQWPYVNLCETRKGCPMTTGAGPNRILDEFAKLMTDAAGAAQGVRREMETAMR